MPLPNNHAFFWFAPHAITFFNIKSRKEIIKVWQLKVSSMIARDLFLENLENLSQELGYELPSGAGAKSDKVASQLLQAYGMKSLEASAKLHFKNTEKAKKLLER